MVVDWFVDIVVRIAVRHQAHVPLNIDGPNIKKLPPTESGGTTTTVELHGEAVLKFHEATYVGVVLLLVGHDPADGIWIIVELMLRRLFKEKELSKKNYQKRICKLKKISNGKSMPTQTKPHNAATGNGQWPTENSPLWKIINSEIVIFCQKRK